MENYHSISEIQILFSEPLATANPPKKSGIYQIKNIINNKIYIGSTNCFQRRRKDHYQKLKNNKHCNPHLQSAFNQYGEENFNFQIIEITLNTNELLFKEQEYLDVKKPYNRKIGYNIYKTSTGPLGRKLSKKHKQKLSLARKGKRFSEEHKKNLSLSICRTKRSKSKLTIEIAQQIRTERFMNKKSYKELMLIFPASYSQIRDICNNNTWNPENEQDKIIPPNNFYALSRTPTLNLDKVNEIRELYNNKILSIKQISNKFNIHVETIREICNYHTWVLPDTIIPIKSKDYNPKAKKLTWQSVRNIKQRIKKEETYKQIAEIFNISISSVRDIAKQICWKDENDPDNKTIDY